MCWLQVMPWAVTANVAFVNTAEQFDLRFPKTGGGEDIDYCLKVTGGRLVPVPKVRDSGGGTVWGQAYLEACGFFVMQADLDTAS
jgi:hypothetical protein